MNSPPPGGGEGKAEGEGFEPSVDLSAHNGFRDRPVQPLRHPSGSGTKPLSGAGPLLSAAAAKKLAQQRRRLVGEQAAGDLGPVVEPRLAEHVEHAAGGAGLRVAAP